MPETAALQVGIIFFLIVVLAVTALAFRWVRIRQLTRNRLTTGVELLTATETAKTPLVPLPDRPFVRRWWVLPILAALALGGVLHVTGLPILFTLALTFMTGLMLIQFDAWRVNQYQLAIEEQLADAIDLLVSALHAGSSLLAGLEIVEREIGQPLRRQMGEVLYRIRYGDNPSAVLLQLTYRVPLESFRLFATVMTVHWETGGELAPSLSAVGHIIRDRLEVARKIRTQGEQVRVSILAIMGVTYFLAFVVWRNDPGRMAGFLATTVGQVLVAGAMLLQVLGIFWCYRLGELKY
jgi:Flp pilus assembly protein TadB